MEADQSKDTHNPRSSIGSVISNPNIIYRNGLRIDVSEENIERILSGRTGSRSTEVKQQQQYMRGEEGIDSASAPYSPSTNSPPLDGKQSPFAHPQNTVDTLSAIQTTSGL